MPLEADYDFGKSAVASGQLSQDHLEECIEVLVALERVGSQKRLWDIVVRKGYMAAEDAARLRRSPGAPAPAASTAASTAASPRAGETDEDTEDAVPVSPGQADSYVIVSLERGGKTRIDRLPARTITLGRHPDCDLMLGDPDVAPQHARLRFVGGGFVAEAIGPVPMAVNDSRAARIQLKSYDVLQLAGALLLYLPEYRDRPAPEPTGTSIVGQPVVRLTLAAGARQGTSFLLGAQPIVIGRHRLANLHIDHPSVSEFHCHIAATGDGPRVLDLKSAAGTRINGAPAAHSILKSGDVITVGDFTVSVKALKPTVSMDSAVELAPRPPSVEISTGSKQAVPPPPPVAGGGDDFVLPDVSKVEVEPSTEMRIRKALVGPDNPTLRQPAPRSFRPGQLLFTCVEGPLDGKKFPLTRRVTLIGREPETDIPILDTSVSRRHAEVVFETDRAEVRDLGSRNGIYINGARQNAAPLRPGDTVRVGKCLFIVEEIIPKPPQKPPTAMPPKAKT